MASAKHKLQNVYRISAAELRQSLPQLMFLAATKPEIRNEIEEMLTMALKDHYEELEKSNRINHLFTCYEEALKLYPHSAQINNNLGAHLFRLKFHKEAATYFRRAVTLDPHLVAAKGNLEKVALAVVERWHFPMLNDTCRNHKFAKSIGRAVASGRDVVLDIGSGSGIFSMVAASCGAKTVFACEASSAIADISVDILKANGFEKVVVLNAMSTDLKVPDHMAARVSLVVTETLDAAVFGERILATLSHAWQHLLLPPGLGKVIPSSVSVYVALVECTWIRNYSRISSCCLESLDIGGLRLSADLSPYTTERLASIPGGFRFLSSPQTLTVVDFNSPQNINDHLTGDVRLTGSIGCEFEGTLDAMALWFDLQVDEENSFNTHPNSKTSCWEQAIFPFLLPPGKDVLRKESKVSYRYDCKENLRLTWADVITFANDDPIASTSEGGETQSYYLLDAKDIAILNQPQYLRLLTRSLLELSEEKVFTDTHCFPIWGLLAVKLGTAQKCRVSDKYKDVVESICKMNSIETSSLSFAANLVQDHDQMCSSSSSVFVDLLDTVNGTVKSACLRKIPLLVNAIIVPYRIRCVGLLVESEDLWTQSRVACDENTLGFEIAKHMNCFKVRNHLGICLSTLRYRQLSERLRIFDFDLNQPSTWFGETNSLTAKLTADGKLTAFVYWFEIRLTKDEWFSTFSADSNSLHAAVILEERVTVMAGSTIIMIESCIADGEIHIEIHHQ